jgi:exodeoxyribonuclease V gamma subunit
MRSVPYRVIALVGMDEGAFPRAAGRDGDDLLLRQPLIGEQDPRSEDRQLLLDAVVAAQQHLVITYSGRDERTNSQRHPAVPLAELMDVLPPDVVQQRPLQPFDWREFAPPHPFSHDQAALAGARVSVQERVGPGVRIGRLPEPAPDAVPRIPGSMRDLTSFLKDPFEDFLRRRFGLRSVRDDEAPPERLPLQLSGLDGWLIGDEGLRLRQTSGDGSTQRAAAIRGGAVPPGAIGEDCLQRIDGAVEKIHQRAEGFRGAEAREITVPVPWLPDEQTTIADVYGNDIVHSTYSKKKPGQLLQIWPQLLCLGIARPDEDLQWFLVANGSGWRITVPDRASCQQHLDELLAVYATGATAPVPVPAATAHAYVHQLRVSRGSRPAALAKASGEWSDGNGRGDGHSSAAGLLYGQAAGFEALLADRPGPDESWYGPAVPSRFEAVARRVWEPILQHSGPLPRKPPQKTVSRAGKRS